MALARKYQITPGQPGFFHCYSRCVRRSFLCGLDPLTGHDFSHRRQWIVDRLKQLSQSFAIDVYAYAIMSNHWHVVLFADPARVQTWTDEDVIRRWRTLFQWHHPDAELVLPTPAQVGAERLNLWREHLGSVSWFMKSLNEPLAHLANAEDQCRGHFWQGRFGCTVLLDDPAVLAAMAYVDLNPIKAHIADALETSDFTSIQRRLREMTTPSSASNDGAHEAPAANSDTTCQPIKPVFKTPHTAQSSQTPNATLDEYIALVEATVVEILPGEAASTVQIPPVLGVAWPKWQQAVHSFDTLFRRVAGAISAVDAFVCRTGRRCRVDALGARLLTPE